MLNFGIMGVAGYIAPKHLRAVAETRNQVVAAVDPHDSVGILDQYFPKAKFFTESESFFYFVESLKSRNPEQQISYISICTPNHLHCAHIQLALRVGANAICEKPLVIDPSDLDSLSKLEQQTGCRVFNVVQLRMHPGLRHLREKFWSDPDRKQADVCLTYITRRGPWYHASWKGNQQKSGGLAINIGIHLFDLLIWIFGNAERSILHLSTSQKMAGILELKRARVQWFLSIDENDLPSQYREAGKSVMRSLKLDGEEIDFSENFQEFHTDVYRAILTGNGIGIEDVRPSVELVDGLTKSEPNLHWDDVHPFLMKSST